MEAQIRGTDAGTGTAATDYAHSRAVLVGVSTYRDPVFPSLRDARNSLERMHRTLLDPVQCGWSSDRVTVIADPESERELAERITEVAEQTTGTLLIYYVGHGLLTRQGDLCLTVTTTRHTHPKITALPWSVVAEALGAGECPAKVKIAFLDCSFSEYALAGASAVDDTTVADLTQVEGVYTLTAIRNVTTHPPGTEPAAECTPCTGELLDLIATGIPGQASDLTLGAIYPELNNRLVRRGLPRPHQRGTDAANSFAFARNASRIPAIDHSSSPPLPTAGEAHTVFNRAEALSEQGNLVGACAAYQEAVNSQDHEIAPLSALRLGRLQQELGDVAGARIAFEVAINSAHPEHGPCAALALANLLSATDDVAAAAAFRTAINSAHHDCAPDAAFQLGDLLRAQGDLGGARAAYQFAVDSAHPSHAPWAAFFLGTINKDAGDFAGAAAAFQTALRLDDPGSRDPASPIAAYCLADLSQEQGDHSSAQNYYRQVLEFRDPAFVQLAATRLGDLAKEQDDLAAACTAYQIALDHDDPDDPSPWIAATLAMILEEQGDFPAAATAYQTAIDSPNPQMRPAAATRLGDMLSRLEDLEGARTAYQIAIDCQDPEWSIKAANKLGHLLKEKGDLAGSLTAFRVVLDSADPELWPGAANQIGMLLRRQGDKAGARAAYQVAIDSGNILARMFAEVNLKNL